MDIIRLLTFAAVIIVHSLAFTEEPSDGIAAGVMMLLQFGREVFFALTGFVLVYSCLGKHVRPGAFWRKRFLYVGLPYVVWSMIYYAFTFVSGPHAPFSWYDLGVDLIDGNAEYHLYFLLVSMQLYLVFPLLIRFVRATASRALVVLGIVGTLNVAWMAILQWVPGPAGWGGFFWSHAYVLLPTYGIYVLAGCYAALHLETLLVLLRAQRRRLALLAVGGLVFTELAYVIQTAWMDPRSANNPLQPAMVVAAISVVILLALIGDAWAGSKRAGVSFIRRGSEISFGIYLFHPVVLTLLCNAGLGNHTGHLPSALATALAVPGTAIGAVVVCLILRRSPLALPLIGRSWVRAARPTRVKRHRSAARTALRYPVLRRSSNLQSSFRSNR